MTGMSSDFQNLQPLTVKNEGIPTAGFVKHPERGKASLEQRLLFHSIPYSPDILVYW